MEMDTTQFYWVVGSIITLMALPFVCWALVRVLVPINDTIEQTVEDAPAMEFTSLGDFWQGVVPHLIELRDRLFKAGIAIVAGTILGFVMVNSNWPFGKPLPTVIAEHFAPQYKLLQTGVGEAFAQYMQIALVIGVTMAMPVVVYQILAFFVPAMRGVEKRIVFTAIPFVVELFLAGLLFGWFFTVPAAVQWLLGYGVGAEIQVTPSVSEFYRTVTTLLLWNGAIFELPAIVFLLARLGFVDTATLARTRRYAIAVIVVVAAIITPTGDPYNLALLAIPMWMLYELGIILTRFVPKRAETAAV